MIETTQAILDRMVDARADTRIHFFDVQLSGQEGGLALQGRVLEESDLRELRARLDEALPNTAVDCKEVQVLRTPGIPVLGVSTNLTSLHRGPSFLAEQLSQLLNGQQVEVLFEDGRWCFVRQMDGYLGWTYRPYLTDLEVCKPTHLLMAPARQLKAGPGEECAVLTRLLGGTELAVLGGRGEWAEVELCGGMRGWLPEKVLRSFSHLPGDEAQRRSQMVLDGARMTGTPYLWGGCSANGIDCSGLAQLLHRWVGITIPRDADMQCAAGRPVEAPFQSGDLLFFGEQGEKRSITHVGISLGGWKMLHSSRSRNGVYTDDVQEVAHLRESFLQAATFME